ncbi:MAG TPA: CsiV family protein [Cellvibrio sp.]|nr:CsiV family protein [Cellvibrio sp.]
MNVVSRFTQNLITGFIGTAALLTAASTMAQTAKPNHEGWYQVELIVFARKDDSGQEHWPSNIKLRYPGDWVDLKDPATTSVTTASSPPTSDLTKEAFYLLPASERQLNAQAKKLENNSRYDLLFHQAWRQVITNKKSSKAILINGGRQFGQHQALEGSIRLSVATYLELQTNLWYSQFDVNVGQEITRQWPELPMRPNYSTVNNAGLSLDSNMELDQALATENQQWANGNFDSNAAAPTETTAPEFVTRQIILLQQERDMRSGEVHYLDHPVLAAIIQITPYTSSTR